MWTDLSASSVVRNLTNVAESHASRVLTFWLVSAVLLTVGAHLALLQQPFVYDHALTSATFAILGRSFVEHGVLALGGVPIQNSGPLGVQPDAYIHWPPLFPIMLSFCFRIFGDGEAVAHGLMLAILLANAGVLYALLKACRGREAGVLAAFSFLVMPVTAKYAHLVVPEHLAVFATLLAVLAFVKATSQDDLHVTWAAFGAVSLMCAIATSWEAVFAAPGLLLTALWNRSRLQQRLAWLYVGASALAVALVFALYIVQRPDLWTDLWHTALFRIGWTEHKPIRLHAFIDEPPQFQMPPWRWVLLDFAGRLELIGQLGSVAVGAMVAYAWLHRHSPDGRGPAALAFGALLATWALWFAIMFNHAYVHDMMMLLAAPPAAAAVGLCGARLIDSAARGRDALRCAVISIVPAILIVSLPLKMIERYYQKKGVEGVTFGRALRDATEPDAVIMVPNYSLVPIYYSRRHMIRGVTDDRVVERVTQLVGETFPESPIYLAMRPASEAEAFPRSVQRLRLVRRSPEFSLFEVRERKAVQ